MTLIKSVNCQRHFNLYNNAFHKHQGWGFQNMLFSSIKVENCYKMTLINRVDVAPTCTMTLYRVSILRWMKLQTYNDTYRGPRFRLMKLSMSIMVNRQRRWRLWKASTIGNSYDDSLRYDAFGKHHLIYLSWRLKNIIFWHFPCSEWISLEHIKPCITNL